MMDNLDYANNTIKKINLYAKNGYVLGKNLLVSWETSHAPMDMRVIEKMIIASIL